MPKDWTTLQRRAGCAFLLLGYVGGSSLLGLWLNPLFVVALWSASAVADVIFTVGSVVVGVTAYAVARRLGPFASIPLALIGTWIVYGTSYLASGCASVEFNLFNSEGICGRPPPPPGWLDHGPWLFVLYMGGFGLLFASLSPTILAMVDRRGGIRRCLPTRLRKNERL